MTLFTPTIKSAGPCRYLQATRKQNHQCRRDFGLPEALKEARRLAITHCEDQFRYDRWNCSIETRGKRNIFQKVWYSYSQWVFLLGKRKFLLLLFSRYIKKQHLCTH